MQNAEIIAPRKSFPSDHFPPRDQQEGLSQDKRDFYFGMQANGFFESRRGKWKFNPGAVASTVADLKSQHVAFFGSNTPNNFFSGITGNADRFTAVFRNPSVLGSIRKLRSLDKDQAMRIAFLYGGFARYFTSILTDTKTADDLSLSAAEFVAKMTRLGDGRSADALAAAASVYVLSGGSKEEDAVFNGNMYHMAEAVSEDPIYPVSTAHLGLSQTARLHAFMQKTGKGEEPFSDIAEDQSIFEGFPTVGAEFHLPISVLKNPGFLKRLAVVNMSQYQRGSQVPLSRDDHGVLEVRMNPSTYPITIANWTHMTTLLPELSKTYFSITLNRNEHAGNFSWEAEEDTVVANQLRTLGLLTYAGLSSDIPEGHKDDKTAEIFLGDTYLGQTVRLDRGQYSLTGEWLGARGRDGQYNIYVGYGKNFSRIAYYLSMGLAEPSMLAGALGKLEASVLPDALELRPFEVQRIFGSLDQKIENDRYLRNVRDAGIRIMQDIQV